MSYALELLNMNLESQKKIIADSSKPIAATMEWFQQRKKDAERRKDDLEFAIEAIKEKQKENKKK